MADLAPIIPLGNMPVVMCFNPTKGYKVLGDFVAAAKANQGGSTTPRPARAIRPISTASAFGWQPAFRQFIYRSRVPPRRSPR